MIRKIKVKIGDVFTINMENGKCYGQVVADGIDKCYIIYDIISKAILEPEEVVKAPIIFLIFTIDGFIEDGRWQVIGNSSIPDNIIFPIFKVDTLDGYMLMDHMGNYLRNASKSEIKELNYHKSVSPALLEHAVMAKFENYKWESYFDEILYKDSVGVKDLK